MNVAEAVALALSYDDGLRASGTEEPAARAKALLEHLAGQGYIVRRRERNERTRLEPSTLDVRSITPAGIRAARLAVGLSGADLARQADISSSALYAIEHGTRVPHARTLEAILDALGRAQAGIDER